MGKHQYVAALDVTGEEFVQWALPPGTWRILTAKTQLITDATPGARYPCFEIISSGGFEATQAITLSPPSGVGPSVNTYLFGAIGLGATAAYAPTYYTSLPDITVEQDDTGLWAACFKNAGYVGPGDIWRGTRFYVEQVSG